ncbi:MAG: hemolysin family protein [Candidatus Eisenbacteria bacterium]|nr:hemolysin family protein [Candidatus Eisenbacteria bacterium]
MTYFVDILQIFAVLLLVGLNGFFVSAEFALVTVRWTRVEELVQQGKFGALPVQKAIEHLDDSIAATQLGITFSSLALGWVGEPAIAHLVEPLFRSLPGGFSEVVTHGAAVAVSFMLITFLHVVLGELAPKAVALERPDSVALVVAAPLLIFGRVFRPFIHFMNGAGNWVVRQLRLPPLKSGSHAHSSDEIDMLIEEGQEAGVIQPDEAKYARAVFELSDKKVRDVMVPRDKVVTIAKTAKPDDILETARMSAHTRMPVWDGDADTIVGIVNTKDLFHIFSLMNLVILEDAMYPALEIGSEVSLARALTVFRREHRQMAIVRDLEGRFLGIVTLEDILEEIVGEIEDEHD